MNRDLEEDFVPDENHLFNQEKTDALVDLASDTEKKEKLWELIVQAACSMKANINLLNLDLEEEYTDQ
jgi:hypothetical protein